MNIYLPFNASSNIETRFMVAEVYGSPEQVMKFYKYNGKKGADMPFNMGLTNFKDGCGGKCVRDLVNNWMSNMPNDQWANWVVSGLFINDMNVILYSVI